MGKKTRSNRKKLEKREYDLEAINTKLEWGEGSFKQVIYKNEPYLRYSKYCNGHKISVRGATEKECYLEMEKRCAEYLDSLEKAKRYEQGSLEADFVGSFEKWFANVKQKERIKPSTLDRCERTLTTRIVGDGKFDGLRVKDVDSKSLNTYMDYLLYDAPITRGKKTRHGYSISEVLKVYDLLSQFFRYFYEKDPTNNPMLRVQKPKEKREFNGQVVKLDEPIDPDLVLTDEEISTFKRVCRQRDSSKWGGVFVFMLETFIRAGEMRALKWKDIDFKNKTVTITETAADIKSRKADKSKKMETVFLTPKTKESRRVVMVSDVALSAIEEWRRDSKFNKDDDRICTTDGGKVITHCNLTNALKRVLNQAGITKKISLHGLRHSGISHWLRKEVPLDVISKMAGHASTQITEQRYYHLVHDQKKAALDLMNKINRQEERDRIRGMGDRIVGRRPKRIVGMTRRRR